MTEAIVIYANIPGFEGISQGLYKNPQFAMKMEFDIIRRLFLKAKRIGDVYEFRINGITYHAKLRRNMEKWEKAYYANIPETCITELMNIYP